MHSAPQSPALDQSLTTAAFRRRGGSEEDEGCHDAHEEEGAMVCRHRSSFASLPPKGERTICSSSSLIIQGLACSWFGRLRILRICHLKPLILGPATSCSKPQRRWTGAFWSSHLCDARAVSKPLTCVAGSPPSVLLFRRKLAAARSKSPSTSCYPLCRRQRTRVISVFEQCRTIVPRGKLATLGSLSPDPRRLPHFPLCPSLGIQSDDALASVGVCT